VTGSSQIKTKKVNKNKLKKKIELKLKGINWWCKQKRNSFGTILCHYLRKWHNVFGSYEPSSPFVPESAGHRAENFRFCRCDVLRLRFTATNYTPTEHKLTIVKLA
jgi:hypothetical protein